MNWYKVAQFNIGDIVDVNGYPTECPCKIYEINPDGSYNLSTQSMRSLKNIPAEKIKSINSDIPDSFDVGQSVMILSSPLLSPGRVIKDNGDGTYVIKDKFGRDMGIIKTNGLRAI